MKELVEDGKILQVHGGALSKSFVAPFHGQHEVDALAAKQQIALKTLKLLRNDLVLLTEGGTTSPEPARQIPDHLPATFFTVSPQGPLRCRNTPAVSPENQGRLALRESDLPGRL